MKEEDIDLAQLLKTLLPIPFLKKVTHFVFTNAVFFIVFLVIGGAMGYYKETTLPKWYVSDMIVESTLIDNTTCKEIITSLQTLLNEKNYKVLETRGINQKVANDLQKIDFVYSGKSDYDKRVTPFKLITYTAKNDQFHAIEDGVMSFLKSNRYVVEHGKRKAQKLNQQQISIQQKIAKLTISQMNIPPHERGTTPEIERLYDQLNQLNAKANPASPFMLIKPLTPKLTPQKPRTYWILGLSLLCSIIGGIALYFVKK